MSNIENKYPITFEQLQHATETLHAIQKDIMNGKFTGNLSDFIEERLRIDTGSGLPISNGWIVDDGEAYFHLEEQAENYCQETYGCSLADMDTDYTYYTEFE